MAKGRKTGGRKRGTRNKSTVAVKDAILAAFEQVGEADYLAQVAREDPRTFCALLGRVLPLQVKGEITGSLQHDHAITIELVHSTHAGPDPGGV